MATIGLLQRAGGCLSPSIREFLCLSQSCPPPSGENGEPTYAESLSFYILDTGSVLKSVQDGTISCPALWADASSIANGRAQLNIVYRLGGPPCLQVLPFKPIRLQPHRQASFKDGSTPALALRLACRAFLPERMHATLYRIVTCLFPRLETMDRELQREWERGAGEQRSPGAGGAEPRLACTPLPQGVRLSAPDGRHVTLRLNFHLACLELCDPGDGAPAGTIPPPACLRSVTSLAEAQTALQRAPVHTPGAGPSVGGPRSGGRRARAVAPLPASPTLPTIPSSPPRVPPRAGPAPPPMSPLHPRCTPSPAKRPLPTAASATATVRQGLALLAQEGSACEACAVLARCAAAPGAAALAVEAGALEALVQACLRGGQPGSRQAGGGDAAKGRGGIAAGGPEGGAEGGDAAARVPDAGAGSSTDVDSPGAAAGAAERVALLAATPAALAGAAPAPAAPERRLALALLRGARDAAEPAACLAALRALSRTFLAAPRVRAHATAAGLAAVLEHAYLRHGLSEEARREASGLADRMIDGPAVGLGECCEGPGLGRIAEDSAAPSGVADPNARSPSRRLPAPLMLPDASDGESSCSGSPTRTYSVASLPPSPQRQVPWRRLGVVPPLNLPGSGVPRPGACDSPPDAGAAGGLTRSTRRARSGRTPAGGSVGRRWAQSPAGPTTPADGPGGRPRRGPWLAEGGDGWDALRSERSAPSPGHGTAPAPSCQLAALAAGVGEALAAACLPAVVAQRRALLSRAARARAPGAGDGAGDGRGQGFGGATPSCEAGLAPMTGPPPAAPTPLPAPDPRARLTAHRILLNARSLCSADSGTSPGEQAAGADVEEESLPRSRGEAAGRDRRSKRRSAALRRACLGLWNQAAPLHRGSWAGAGPFEAALALRAAGGDVAPADPASRTPVSCNDDEEEEEEESTATLAALTLLRGPALPALLAGRVEAGLRAGRLAAAAAAWEALGRAAPAPEGAARCDQAARPSPAGASIAARLAPALQASLGALRGAGGPESWPADAWRLLGSALPAWTAALAWAGPEARPLLRPALADAGLEVLHAVALRTLCSPSPREAPGDAGSGRGARAAPCPGAATPPKPALARALLELLTALARAVTRVPALPDGRGAVGHGESWRDPGEEGVLPGRTRRGALRALGFALHPDFGLASRWLVSAPGACNARVRQAAFAHVRTLLGEPGSPHAQHKPTADFYVRHHFVQFLRLYHNPHRDHQALLLCRQHLGVLQVLAGQPGPARARLLQLSVLDFCTRELSLEMGMQESAWAPAQRTETLSMDSAGSVAGLREGLPHLRRLSGAGLGGAGPTDPGPHSSRAPSPAKPTPAVPRLRLGGAPAPSTGVSPGASSVSPAGSPGASATPGTSATGPVSGRPPLHPSARGSGTPLPSSRLHSVSGPLSGGGAPSRVPSLSLGAGPFAARTASGTLQLALPAAASILERDEDGSGGSGDDSESGGEASSSEADSGAGDAAEGASQSDSDSDSGGDASPGTGTCSDASAPGHGREQDTRSAPGLPAGLVLTGDLEEDLDRLEEAEARAAAVAVRRGRAGARRAGKSAPFAGLPSPAGSGDERAHSPGASSDSEAASPTIAAVRGPGSRRAAPPAAVPALALAKALPVVSRVAGDGNPGPGTNAAAEQLRRPLTMPRLALGKSCHSTLAGREAAAMLVTSREAECGSGARTEGSARILEAGSGGAPGALALMGQRQRSLPSSARQRRRSISSVTDASEPGSLAAELSYREERKARPLYASPALHAQVLALVLRLLVSPAGRMDRGASDPFPCERGLPNAPHVLRHHLAHPGNAGVLADLAARCAGMGPATLRLLRLVSGAGFRPAWYARRARMSGAAGAYATVHRCALPAFLADSPGAPPRRVVLKVLDAARGVQDRCSSVDVHAEVGVMQALTDSRRAARLHDYGFDPGEEAYVLVLQEYACSLRQWRLAQAEGGPRQAGTYLRIFREILRAVQELADRGIAHFDLKCDNVLLQPRDPPSSQGPRGTPGSMQDALPFEVVLADFGESIQFDSRAEAGAPSLAAASGVSNAGADPGQQLGATAAITNRVRGTDVFKSPEMLLLGGAHDHMDGDRRRRRGVGPASDVWSLGCLLFELVTGQHLVTDPDWATLVARVAAGRLPLFTPDRLRLIQDCPAILDLIRFMLVREAQLRPTLRDVSLRVEVALACLGQQPLTRPAAGNPRARHHESTCWPRPPDSEPMQVPPGGLDRLDAAWPLPDAPPAVPPAQPLTSFLPVKPWLSVGPLAAVGSSGVLQVSGGAGGDGWSAGGPASLLLLVLGEGAGGGGGADAAHVPCCGGAAEPRSATRPREEPPGDRFATPGASPDLSSPERRGRAPASDSSVAGSFASPVRAERNTFSVNPLWSPDARSMGAPDAEHASDDDGWRQRSSPQALARWLAQETAGGERGEERGIGGHLSPSGHAHAAPRSTSADRKRAVGRRLWGALWGGEHRSGGRVAAEPLVTTTGGALDGHDLMRGRGVAAEGGEDAVDERDASGDGARNGVGATGERLAPNQQPSGPVPALPLEEEGAVHDPAAKHLASALAGVMAHGPEAEAAVRAAVASGVAWRASAPPPAPREPAAAPGHTLAHLTATWREWVGQTLDCLDGVLGCGTAEEPRRLSLACSPVSEAALALLAVAVLRRRGRLCMLEAATAAAAWGLDSRLEAWQLESLPILLADA